MGEGIRSKGGREREGGREGGEEREGGGREERERGQEEREGGRGEEKGMIINCHSQAGCSPTYLHVIKHISCETADPNHAC